MKREREKERDGKMMKERWRERKVPAESCSDNVSAAAEAAAGGGFTRGDCLAACPRWWRYAGLGLKVTLF